MTEMPGSDSRVPPPSVDGGFDSGTAGPPGGGGPPSSGRIFWSLMGGCLLLALPVTALIAALIWAGDRDTDIWLPGDSVAVVEVLGEIVDARPTVDDLYRYADNTSVKAIVLRIDSPGGAIVPSQEIYHEILKIRESTGKPIVASLDGLAASGGYYIASACDLIVANEGTVTGSIGVIAQWMNLEGILEWARIHPETITSGAMKDVGSPYRAMTEEERSYYQSLVNQFHEQFIRSVLAGRDGRIEEESLRKIADGRVFTGQEALGLHLVDRIGTFRDAVDVAAELAGLEGTPRLLYPKPEEPGLLDLLLSARARVGLVERVTSPLRQAEPFLYRWH